MENILQLVVATKYFSIAEHHFIFFGCTLPVFATNLENTFKQGVLRFLQFPREHKVTWECYNGLANSQKKYWPCPSTSILLSQYTFEHTMSLTIEMHVYEACYRSWHIDGLVQERRNSSALAMELRLCCTNPSIWRNGSTLDLMLNVRSAFPASVTAWMENTLRI